MRYRKTIIAGSVAFSIAAGSAVLAAQSEVPSNPNILAAINALRADLTAVFTSLTQTLQIIQTAVLPIQSNVAQTQPFVYQAAGGAISCSVSNKATEDRFVDIQVIAGNTIVDFGGVNVGPGGSGALSSSNVASGIAYCRFSVRSGSRNDVAAGATQFVGGAIVAAVPAQ